MNVLVVGSDLRTQLLIKSLFAARHSVRLISDDKNFCAKIAEQCDQMAVFGNATKPETLASAGTKQCDIVISLMERDADNLLVCELAKQMFKVPRTISSVENPVNRTVFRRLGVDSVVCPVETCVRMVEEAMIAAE